MIKKIFLFILIILGSRDFNSFNFKNLCNFLRHKCKTPWWWNRYVETCSSTYYKKIHCCDINCISVGCNKNKNSV